MIEPRRIAHTLAAVALLAVPIAGTDLAAQDSVPADEAQAFIGQWNLNLEGGPEPFTMPLDIDEEGGQLTAEVAGMDGETTAVETISKTDENLVLRYTSDFQGQSFPVAITLTPDGDNLQAAIDFADGQFTVTGTGTRR